MVAKKLVLVVVDSLKPEMLDRAVAAGEAPHFAELLARGSRVEECWSTFPSVTPVACSAIATGAGPGTHRVAGMNWFHRGERRYVEYGSSFQSTRVFGIVRTLYDVVYNMNLSHLTPEVDTIFERLEDAGLRTAVTPFLIYRGRRRHEVGLEGLMRRVAHAATFRHAVYGPSELFYGELYSSRKVPCRPTMARPGTRDEYSGCVGEYLVEQDLYDFLLFSLPDNDHHSHRFGPHASGESITHADRNFGRLVAAAGGIDAFLDEHAVILMADHSQTPVEWPLPLIESLAEEWRVLRPNDERAGQAEIAVSPCARAGGVYILSEGSRRRRAHSRLGSTLGAMEGVDLVAWLADSSGKPLERDPEDPLPRGELEAVVQSRQGELRFHPGTELSDARGARWDLEGDHAVLDAVASDGVVRTDGYPDGLGRLWSALCSPNAGDLLISAELGYECFDWGGAAHVGGGSHGSLRREDSHVPLVFVGCGPEGDELKREWGIADVAPVVLGHYGLAAAEAGA